MAKKMNAMRLAQETRGYAELTHRRPAPVAPALYLMQLRLPRLRIAPLSRKLPVTGDSGASAQTEHAVKIIHLA